MHTYIHIYIYIYKRTPTYIFFYIYVGSYTCLRSIALPCGLVSLVPMEVNIWAAG